MIFLSKWCNLFFMSNLMIISVENIESCITLLLQELFCMLKKTQVGREAESNPGNFGLRPWRLHCKRQVACARLLSQTTLSFVSCNNLHRPLKRQRSSFLCAKCVFISRTELPSVYRLVPWPSDTVCSLSFNCYSRYSSLCLCCTQLPLLIKTVFWNGSLTNDFISTSYLWIHCGSSELSQFLRNIAPVSLQLGSSAYNLFKIICPPWLWFLALSWETNSWGEILVLWVFNSEEASYHGPW